MFPLSSVNKTASFVLNNGITKLAVPFFFISSGYFLSNKINNWSSTKIYILKILKMYIIWTIIYIPLIAFSWVKYGWDIAFFIKASVFAGTYLHFWYLTALIFASAFLYFGLKKISLKNLFFIALILFFIGLMGQPYYTLTEKSLLLTKLFNYYFKIFLTVRNGLFFGLVFMIIGMLIKDKKFPNKRNCIIGLAISFIMIFFEIFFLKNFLNTEAFDIYISLLPASYFLFALILQIKLPDKNYFYYLRQMSLLIFLSHPLMRFFSELFVKINNVFDHSMMRYLVVLFFSIAFSAGVVFIENKKGFKWLKFLH